MLPGGNETKTLSLEPKFHPLLLTCSSLALASLVASRLLARTTTTYRTYYVRYVGYVLDTFQDFLINEHMKPCMRILEISISSQNHVIVRPTKTPKLADKKCAQFY